MTKQEIDLLWKAAWIEFDKNIDPSLTLHQIFARMIINKLDVT